MKTQKIPMRKCIGCNTSKPKKELIRVACYEGEVSVDITGKAKGRGVYICKNKECLKKAVKKKAFARAFGQDITEEQQSTISEEIEKYEQDQ